MKLFVVLLPLGMILSAGFAQAESPQENRIKMSFNNEDLVKVIETYSKAAGQKFVLDSGVRGKATILLPEAVSTEEAFSQLSSALAINGFAISKQGDTMVVRSARNIQRDLIEVSTERPAIKPERMYTWIYTLKNIPADQVNREVRMLTSKDGELSVNLSTNQLIICDWVSNLNRVADILKEIDKKNDPATAKLVEISKKEREFFRHKHDKKEETKVEPKTANE